jgi:hypothetical protein
VGTKCCSVGTWKTYRSAGQVYRSELGILCFFSNPSAHRESKQNNRAHEQSGGGQGCLLSWQIMINGFTPKARSAAPCRHGRPGSCHDDASTSRVPQAGQHRASWSTNSYDIECGNCLTTQLHLFLPFNNRIFCYSLFISHTLRRTKTLNLSFPANFHHVAQEHYCTAQNREKGAFQSRGPGC